jgi:hypothetical protein
VGYFDPFSQEINEMAKTQTATKERPVIVTTEHRGVFFGYAQDTTGPTINLRGARMAIRFGTTRGLMELAETGPTPNSKISARADMEARKITAVFEVAPEAVEKWEGAK